MFAYHRHVHVASGTGALLEGRAKRPSAFWLAVIAIPVALAVPTVLHSWRWADRTFFHWGVTSMTPQTTMSRATLLDQVHSFRLETVRQTYAGQVHRNVAQVFDAGPVHTKLPDWLAGQQLSAQGKVAVAAGVDLAQVSADDITVGSSQHGKDVQVSIRIPAARVMSTELMPNTLTLSVGSGFLTGVLQDAGAGPPDLRARAADQVMSIARDTAVKQGLLDEASREAEQRLHSFLDALPHGDQHVTYSNRGRIGAGVITGSAS